MFAPLIAKPKTKQAGLATSERGSLYSGTRPRSLASVHGNQTLSRVLNPVAERADTKLKIGHANDRQEREADRMAAGALRLPEEGAKQASSKAPAFAPPSVHEVLRSPGQPLDLETRTYMEPRFGQSFSDVRLHIDQRARQSAREINARAYSAGQHVVFGANQYSPTSPASRRLIAHELAHFVQQRSTMDSMVVRRQPAIDIHPPVDEPSTKSNFSGSIKSELGGALLELADKGVRDPALYTKAIKAAGPEQKRYVYSNSYAMTRLADAVDLATFEQCVKLLEPDSQGRVLAGILRLKKKYDLAEVKEDGSHWTEDELAIADRKFSKLSSADKDLLRGTTLVRKKEIPSVDLHGKKFKIAGETSGGSLIELTEDAFRDPYTILHETGHLIQQKQARVRTEALRASKTFTDMEAARQRLNKAVNEAKSAGGGDPEFVRSLNQMGTAIQTLIDGPPESVQENQGQLNLAESQADADRTKEHSKVWLDVHDRMKEFADAVERFAPENAEIKRSPDEIEKTFVGIVKKDKLDNKGFAPFTDYVAHNWPEKPQEFLVQSYATWRVNPNYIKVNAPNLFDWFEGGGYKGMKKDTK